MADEAAGRVVAGRGRIVVEFFDVGVSRSVPWPRRAQAAALLAAAADPDRCFDAVVVGEFERAFAGDEAPVLIALLESFGVQVWLPEARGRIDLGEPEDRALLRMLGHRSEYEVLRNRFRTGAAMAAQVREQGRNVGGRPPYGYRLVDAGPHPKLMHAAWGRRRHRLDVDPVTAPHVRWIFERRREGMSMAAIARSLNERGVASPGVYDRERNRHRVGSVWTLRTVAAIVENPRYTGRQVWNRQFTDHREAVPGDRRSSQGPARVWNSRTDWVICEELTHPPLVSDDDFLAVQQITALEKPEDGRARRYPFRGLLVCGVCGRRLEGHWVNRRAAYRCRHGRTSAHPRDADGPRWVYWSQARLTEAFAGLDADLAQPGDPDGAAAYLRARDAVVVCGPRTIAIENAVLDEEGPVEPRQEVGAVQLELPLPSPGVRVRGRKSLRKPKARSRGRRRKGRTPSQDRRRRTSRSFLGVNVSGRCDCGFCDQTETTRSLEGPERASCP
ncbi:recombinase family protein [Actinoplanes sp. KI2]|uniref:recombinase family protein n=1 Tax=Actinoplanes sp. KI2 TaxID=2983315 RepID=UPI0021D571B1|nr:recombinase family protein [Actinoplanes sp. KI2]MCU7729382.1 recombinase family protein [Actinoplanes sp. KI2]